VGTLTMIIVQLVAGWPSGLTIGQRGFGVVAAGFDGMVRTLVGSHFLGCLGIVTLAMLGSILAALVGAVMLLSLIRP
jgi:uncharacterized membrane protein YeaQ/YmgE (transglycosylase-associated protein family)